MKKPTVGAMVFFFRNRGTLPQPALITSVINDREIGIVVFNDRMIPCVRSEVAVHLRQGDMPIPNGGRYCEWMPAETLPDLSDAELEAATRPS